MAVASAKIVIGADPQDQVPCLHGNGAIQVQVGRVLRDQAEARRSVDVPGIREDQRTIDGGRMRGVVTEDRFVGKTQQNRQRVPVQLVVMVVKRQILDSQVGDVIDHRPMRIVVRIESQHIAVLRRPRRTPIVGITPVGADRASPSPGDRPCPRGGPQERAQHGQRQQKWFRQRAEAAGPMEGGIVFHE